MLGADATALPRRRSRHALAAAAVLAGLAAVGCGGGPEADPATALRPVDINPQPRERVRDGGTLRLAIVSLPTQFNANHVVGAQAETTEVLGGLMPGQFIYDERGRSTVDRNYVLDARITATRPQQVVTYRLNPRARWSDGKPITWRDFEAQWRATRGDDDAYEVASTTGMERVASVRQGRDQFEVVVAFGQPYAEWQAVFSGLYPAETNRDPEAFNTDYVNRIPTTAGPFRFAEIDRTAQTITLERDPNWWGEPAKLDRMIFRALAPEAQISAFTSGEIDTADVGPVASSYRRALGVPGGAVRQAAGPDYRHITFNGTSPALRDINVRRAVAAGINREALARADLAGLNWPIRPLDNHIFMNTQESYRSNSGDIGRFDQARARQLLDQAGWRPGPGGVRTRGGRPLALRFVIPTGIPTSRQEAELTQAMLRDIGIRVEIESVPPDDFLDQSVPDGNFDLAPFSWIGSPLPISPAKSLYETPKRGPGGELAVQQNFARIGTPELDRLLNGAQGELDLARARDMMNEADRLIWEEVHSLTLYQRPEITAVRQNLANTGSFGLKSAAYEDIGFVR